LLIVFFKYRSSESPIFISVLNAWNDLVQADITKIKSFLDYEVKTNFREGMEQYLDILIRQLAIQ